MFSVVSVCLSVCVSLCVSVQAIPFDPPHIGTSFLVRRYILKIMCKKWFIIYFKSLFLCMWFKAINKIKVTNQGQGYTSRSRSNECHGQIKVTSKERYKSSYSIHYFILKITRRKSKWKPFFSRGILRKGASSDSHSLSLSKSAERLPTITDEARPTGSVKDIPEQVNYQY